MHPVSFELDYEIGRNRLTSLFRFLLVIPWMIVGLVYGLIAEIAALIAWFAMLFTKRYPEPLYDFVAGYVRFSARIGGFSLLATDEFPSFWGGEDDNYPIRVDFAPRQAEYSRAKTFFKVVLAFPQIVLSYGIGLLLYGAAIIDWFRILFTGRQSVTMHDALRVGLAYDTRANAFLLLLTEVHPRLLDLPPQELPDGAPAMPPLGAGGGGGRLPASSAGVVVSPGQPPAQ